HLQSFPFDKIKIDRSFVATMNSKRASRKIVGAVIGLGHSLGLTTVAEGIEEDEQVAMLRLLGCELGQGWLYGKALGPQSLADVVSAKPHVVPNDIMHAWGTSAASLLEAMPTQRLGQMQAIFEGAPVGLCFLDSHMRYLSINQQLAEMNGLPVEDHLGRKVADLFPRWFPNAEGHIINALRGNGVRGARIVRPSSVEGHPDRVVVASYQPVWDEVGEVVGVLIAVLEEMGHQTADPELVNSAISSVMEAGGIRLSS
ncbi:MAG: EAL domain-containing protein, partial [Acidobacteriota bacterium]